MSDADRDEAWYWDTGVSSQQDDERKERWHLFLDDELVTMRFALADEKQEPWKSKAPRLHKQITDEQDRRASLLRSSLQPSQPVPDPVHDEAADAPSGPLEWRRIADNVFRLSRWLDSIGRADWGHELRRASGELSRAHDLAQPSQMDVDALAHPRPFKLEGDEWGGTVEGVCAYDIADMNIEWTYCPFCGGRLHRLFGVSPQDGSESR